VQENTSWQGLLDKWLAPFLEVLGNKSRRQWAPLYVLGLLLPGDRKSMQPMSARVAPKKFSGLHHFISDAEWATEPLEDLLCQKVDQMLGGSTSYLIIDDTGLPKKGKSSVGVSHQYCGALGKQANCQVLVSLTLAKNDVQAPVGLRLYLPEAWAADAKRREKAKVPEDVAYKPKWQIALNEIDRIERSGVRFGTVLADAGYGLCAEFRRELTKRGHRWAVGILSTQSMYTASVEMKTPIPQAKYGRPRTRVRVDELPLSASKFIEMHGKFQHISWRRGTKGRLSGDFAIVRVKPADGPEARGRHSGPGEEAWLVCELLSGGERKYYLANLPAATAEVEVISAIKARWACEQMHQQTKEELGLDHFEGRSWIGLHHHTLMTMIAFAFLVKVRTNKNISKA
jgi:SRSO17 transposase